MKTTQMQQRPRPHHLHHHSPLPVLFSAPTPVFCCSSSGQRHGLEETGEGETRRLLGRLAPSPTLSSASYAGTRRPQALDTAPPPAASPPRDPLSASTPASAQALLLLLPLPLLLQLLPLDVHLRLRLRLRLLLLELRRGRQRRALCGG